MVRGEVLCLPCPKKQRCEALLGRSRPQISGKLSLPQTLPKEPETLTRIGFWAPS